MKIVFEVAVCEDQRKCKNSVNKGSTTTNKRRVGCVPEIQFSHWGNALEGVIYCFVR